MGSREVWTDRLLSVLRIVFGFLFIEYGMQKILNYPPGDKPMHPAMYSQIWFAGMIELVGGALLILGLFTRMVAFVCSGQMAFAYFIGHAKHGFWPVVNHGVDAVAFCFVFLYLAAAGGGAWSLDHLISKKRKR